MDLLQRLLGIDQGLRFITGARSTSSRSLCWRLARICHSSSGVGYPNSEPEDEPVKLRLGKGIGALELDGVLGGDHQERPLELVGGSRRP